MKKILSGFLTILLVISVIPTGLFSITASAKTEYFVGDIYSGTVTNGKATITYVSKNVSGELVIPSNIFGSVTTIDYAAFQNCTRLTSVTIPDSVTSIPDGVFSGCASLVEIKVDSKNSVYHSKDNCIIVTETNELVAGCQKSIIPNYITRIAHSAFYGHSGLTSITIPDSVISIGNAAFYGTGCYNDKNNWENDVLYIDNNCIESKTLLTGEYKMKSGTKRIADYAFAHCSGLTNVIIPDSVTSIGERAFIDCSSLTNINIPNSVTNICYGAFENCTGLISITIPESVTNIGFRVFSGCTGIETVNYNAINCGGMYYAFEDCQNVKTVNIGQYVKVIPSYAFAGFYAITSITIPNSVTTIGGFAFDGCTGLTSITIPEGVTKIGYHAFYNCNGLKTVTINCEIVDIGVEAFGYCTNLTTVNYNGTNCVNTNEYILWNEGFNTCPNLTTVNIGENVTQIPTSLFADCTSITTVNFNATNCIKMSSNVNPLFKNCSSITTINIGDNVTQIPNYAFMGCVGITSITIPNNVRGIGYGAFTSSSSLEKVNYLGSCVQYSNLNISNGNTHLLNAEWTYNNVSPDDHIYDNSCDIVCNVCDFEREITLGDVDGVEGVTDADAEYMLMYTFFPEDYPVNQNCDFNGDGKVSDADAEYLLMFTRHPEEYSLMPTSLPATTTGSCSINGNSSVTVGSNIEFIIDVSGCVDATSIAVAIDYSDDFEFVSGTWLKSGSISVFDVSTKKGALGVLSSPNVNGNLFKIVLKAKTSSMQSQNVGVNVIAKNDLTEILNVNSSKLIKINCATHSCGMDYICDVCGFVDCNIEEMFSDVSNDAWYSEALTYAVSTGLLKGYTNGNFGTSDGIQRQDFLVMLARFDGADLTAYANNHGNFTDVSADSYYEAAVNWGKANNIVNGYVNGAFGVGDKITREQIVTFMHRYARYKGLDTSVTPSAKQRIQNRYYDFRNVSDFAMDAIYWAIDRGVINGKENNTAIVPQGNAQRCEVAQIMFNIHKNNIF